MAWSKSLHSFQLPAGWAMPDLASACGTSDRGAKARDRGDERKERTMSFTTYQEVATDGRARRRKLAGEGMLMVQKSFTWRGERYKAGVTRVSPDHPVCDSQHGNLLTPAYDRESSPAVLRFLERRIAQQSPPAAWGRRGEFWRLGGKSWRLPARQSWRLG
jgi:hypothetical protein